MIRTPTLVVALILGTPAAAESSDGEPTDAAQPSAADGEGDPARPTPFDQGRLLFDIALGVNDYASDQYFAVGVAGRIFVIDGLGLGFGVEQWLGPFPLVTKLSPDLRYVFFQLFPYSPYVGIFYRHWFIYEEDGEYLDVDALGVRAGMVWSLWFDGGITLGIAYEGVVSPCSSACHFVLPEIGFAIGF